MSHPSAHLPPPSLPLSPVALTAALVPQGVMPSVSPDAASPFSSRRICRIVRQSTWEMFCLVGQEQPRGRNSRHAATHIRQIAIYVCHVGLSIPVVEVASCFGRDPATIRANCLLVEERRENPGFDDFVSAIERLSKAIYRILQEAADESRN